MSSIQQRYLAAIHRAQSAVKFILETDHRTGVSQLPLPDTSMASAKHLRVGIESALASNEAVARLLIEKGIFTQEELSEAVTVETEARADALVETARERIGDAQGVLDFG